MNKENNTVKREEFKKESSKQFETNINFFGNGMHKDIFKN